MAPVGPGVVIACGPSLTAEDVNACKGATVYAVNDAYRLAPWADHLFACDYSWWQAKIDDVQATFTGRCWSISAACQQWGVNEVRSLGPGCGLPDQGLYHAGHSGQMAISLAILHGYRSIVLLGFDHSRSSSGATHFHGGHADRLHRAKVPYDKWITCADTFSRHAHDAGIRIVNASRETALTCYPRMTIEEALND